MTNKEKLILYNNFKNVLEYVKTFQEVKQQEKPKVLALTRKFYGKSLKVA